MGQFCIKRQSSLEFLRANVKHSGCALEEVATVAVAPTGGAVIVLCNGQATQGVTAVIEITTFARFVCTCKNIARNDKNDMII